MRRLPDYGNRVPSRAHDIGLSMAYIPLVSAERIE